MTFIFFLPFFSRLLFPFLTAGLLVFLVEFFYEVSFFENGFLDVGARDFRHNVIEVPFDLLDEIPLWLPLKFSEILLQIRRRFLNSL